MKTVILALLVIAAASQPARADDATRIKQLESEIRVLRIQLDDQQRRIEKLEAAVQVQDARSEIMPKPGLRVARPAAAAAGPLPWHSQEAWGRIKPGMTAAEVTAILGEPTSVEAAETLKTLFYRGSAPGRGALYGHVNFRGDRVVAVSRPDFG